MVGVSESIQLYDANSLKASGLILEAVSLESEGMRMVAILDPVFLRRKLEGVDGLDNCKKDMVPDGQSL